MNIRRHRFTGLPNAQTARESASQRGVRLLQRNGSDLLGQQAEERAGTGPITPPRATRASVSGEISRRSVRQSDSFAGVTEGFEHVPHSERETSRQRAARFLAGVKLFIRLIQMNLLLSIVGRDEWHF